MWQDIVHTVAFLADVATAFGLPIAAFVFWREKRRERHDREWGTYNSLDEKYIEYLKMCVEFPELDAYNYQLEDNVQLTNYEKTQRVALFEILVSILERSYLMYFDQSSKIKEKQWVGWHNYIVGWKKDPRFAELWPKVSEQYDSDFVAYVNDISVA